MIKKKIFFLLLGSLLICFTVIACELICRVYVWLDAKYFSSSHKYPDYPDVYAYQLGEGGFLKPSFNGSVINCYGKPVAWKTNSFGFRYEKDISYEPGENTVRVLSLGDSFTAGYRVRQQQTFSKMLENDLNKLNKKHKYEILISVTEEPNGALSYLSSFGVKFKPKTVILGITLGNDLVQNYFSTMPDWGYFFNDARDKLIPRYKVPTEDAENLLLPKECLISDTVVVNPPAEDGKNLSNFFCVRMVSQLFRKYGGECVMSIYGPTEKPKVFDLCNGLSLFVSKSTFEIDAMYSRLFETINKIKRISEKENFRLVVVIFPQRFQIQKEDWLKTIYGYRLKESSFDLMKPNKLIMEFCNKEHIDCIDPTLDMAAFYNKKRKSLYFPLGDMHFNALGNKVLYDTIKEKVCQLINESL